MISIGKLLKFQKKGPDAELETFRTVMETPDTFEDGFKLSSLMGALFLALIMVPGSLYMELVAGLGIGNAAQWVTVLLFVEVAKRANAKLSRAQLFILFYMSGILVGQSVHGMPLFTQFLVRSNAAVSSGISSIIPHWVAPPNIDELPRTFLNRAWLPAILLISFRMLMGRFENSIVGYGLFRIVSDIEKLPFPMAPTGAQGIVAVAEQVEGSAKNAGTSVRWRMFCVGSGIGMIFGLLYMALPTLTGAIFPGAPVRIFPIPFADFTPFTGRILPAVATGMSFDMGQFIIGMVLPFYAMLGSFISLVFIAILNPMLYQRNMLPTWDMGDGTVVTLFANNVDFYFSFNIGISLSIALFGLLTVVTTLRKRRAAKNIKVLEQETLSLAKKRGDISSRLILFTYFIAVMSYIIVSGWLIDWHPGVMIVLFFFGFFYTPFISYVTSKLEGMAGQVIEIPFIRELAFILSGYNAGVAVWFIPIPRANYGIEVTRYKQAELLGCKFTSIWKSQIVLFPVILISMIVFSSFIWSLAPIPSETYPFTRQIWEFEAKNACLLYSSTMGEYSLFREALGVGRFAAGLGTGVFLLLILNIVGAPTMLMFGMVRGLGQTMPHGVLPNFIGALIGKFYFQRKYGREWRKLVPVISAGFFVGGGLISILAIGIVFLLKSISTVPY